MRPLSLQKQKGSHLRPLVYLLYLLSLVFPRVTSPSKPKKQLPSKIGSPWRVLAPHVQQRKKPNKDSKIRKVGLPLASLAADFRCCSAKAAAQLQAVY